MSKGKGGRVKLSAEKSKNQLKKQVPASPATANKGSGKYRGDAGSTIVENCTCASSFQDRLYGDGMRVKNKKRGGGVRCTACGK